MNHVLSIVLYAISAMFVLILYNCYKYKTIKGAKAFGILIIVLFFNSFGYASELLTSSLGDMLFWIRFEYIGIAFTPLAVIYFIREYADERRLANNKLLFGIFLLNLLTFILVQTNQYHYLYYSSVGVDYSHDFPVLMFEKGIGYKLQGAVLILALSYSVILIIKRAIELKGSYRKRSLIVLSGLLMPGVTAAYYVFELGPSYIDITPFSFFLLSIITIFGLFRYNVVFFSQVTHEMIFNTIEEAVLVVDDEEHIVRINEISKSYFDELQAMSVGEHLEAYPFVRSLVLGQAFQIIEKDDRYFQVRNIKMAGTYGHVLVFTDITENHLAKKRLEEMAITDPLTKLYNRRYFVEQFLTLTDSGVMILVDVDHFKRINDQYGHSEGDRILIELSNIIKEVLPESVVCRYGGEEFLIYQMSASLEMGVKLAEKLRLKVEMRQDPISYTISSGVCLYKVGDFMASVNQADELLYQAKDGGRNQVRTLAYG